jgi:choline dehydrogenase-like flavoprotein
VRYYVVTVPNAAPYDVVIVGSGPSGTAFAQVLVRAGRRCLLLEAGDRFAPSQYPRNERDGNARLFWGGGAEFDGDARMNFLRARVLGGGSVVDQALWDRFDTIALDDFRAKSGIDDFDATTMAAWYDRAERLLELRTIPEAAWNENAKRYARAFAAKGYRFAALRRAQSDCRWNSGNDCIACLNGCRAGSKQSMAQAVLPALEAAGLEVRTGVTVQAIQEKSESVTVLGRDASGRPLIFFGRRLVLAAGPCGNVPLLARAFADAGKRPPKGLGEGFFAHPQFMTFGVFREPVDAHRGAFQALQSDEPRFREAGFKLTNGFAPPAVLAMLVPERRRALLRKLATWRHWGAIEVAVRDATPGRIVVSANGRVRLERPLRAEDRARRDRGLAVARELLAAAGAIDVFEGRLPVGLHLMGGCRMGADDRRDVVDPDGRVYGFRRLHVGDGSIFPAAPGLNPTLTITAVSLRNAEKVLRWIGREV